MKQKYFWYFSSALVLLISICFVLFKSDFLKSDGKELLKYSNHPQTFESSDPNLQEQWESLKEVLCDNEHMKYYKIMIGQPINFATVFNVMTTPSTDLSNIWSHLLFFFFFIKRAFRFSDRFFWLNCVTAYTYLMSACYHIFRNYNRRLYDIFLCCDVSSIAIQIYAYNIVDSISFFSKKKKNLKIMYIAGLLISELFILLSIPIILRYKLYTFRTVLFSLVATFGFLLIYHGYRVNGYSESFKKLIINRVISYALQGLGIFFRGSHIPERFFQDTVFQEFFHSHFFFHIAAAIGSVYACISSESIANL